MTTIRYYAPIRAIVKKESEEADLTSIKDVLNYVKSAYGKDAYSAAKSAFIVVNDVSIGLFQGVKTELKDGDVVGFLPVCGGGLMLKYKKAGRREILPACFLCL